MMNTCHRCRRHDSKATTSGLDTRPQLKENSCVVCSKFEKLNRDIDRALELRRAYYEEVNQTYDPIHGLPPEVVSLIFVFCLPRRHSADIFQVPLDAQKRYAGRRVQYILGSVCRYWRRIAWSTPSLWNILWLHITIDTAVHFNKWVADWLSRSGKLPLYVRMFWAPDSECRLRRGTPAWESIETMINHLSQYSERFKVLDLRLIGDHISQFGKGDPANDLILDRLDIERLDALEGNTDLQASDELSIPFEFKLGRKASPTYVTFKNMRLKDIDLHWVNVTHLIPGELFKAEAVSALQLAPQLKHLEVIVVRSIIEPVEPHLSTVTHNSLKFLSILSDETTAFLDHLTCPALESFTWGPGSYSSLPVQSFFKRSNCPLKCLTLSECKPMEENNLFPILHLTPSIRHFSVFRLWFPTKFFKDLCSTACFRRKDKDKFLPRLRALVFAADIQFRTGLPWSSLLSVFPDSVVPDDAVRRPLSSLKVFFLGARDHHRQSDISIFDLATLSKILQLREKGIKIEVKDSSGFDYISPSRQFHGI